MGPEEISSIAERLVSVGETIERRTRFSRDEIARFSRATFDENPLHLDAGTARRSGFADTIASGQQTAAMMMGLLATHYSRGDDGVAREMLCLNMNLAFKEPVLAGQDVVLRWKVATIEWKEKLQGLLVQLDGSATVGSDAEPLTALIARGTILVKAVPTVSSTAAVGGDEAEVAELRS